MRKANDGFTLIELLVGILCATIITGAAMSLLLMGARTNHSLSDANSEQQTARIIMTMVEMLASEGNIKTVETVGDEDDTDCDWALLNRTEQPILYYSAAADAIRNQDGSNLMTGVTASTASFEGRLLNFTIQTEDDSYSSAVFCRTVDVSENEKEIGRDGSGADQIIESEITTSLTEKERENRFTLLAILCAQYGSKGEIKGSNPQTYFSEWYLQEQGREYGGDWNEETPWCACFLSWAVAQLPDGTLNKTPYFANVTTGWTDENGNFEHTRPRNEHSNPTPGDFIFFSWDDDSENLEHVGVVFAVDTTWVYTIEGNSSGTVALRRYLHDDKSIIGYGVLDWA